MRIRLAVLTAAASILALTAAMASAKPVLMLNVQHRLAQQNALHGTASSSGITVPAPPCPQNGIIYPPPPEWPSAVPYLFYQCGITELPATGFPIPGNMSYWGGPVETHPKQYLIYWGWGEPGAFPGQSCSPETLSEGSISATLKCDPDGAGKYMADFVHQLGGTNWAKVSTQFAETGSGGGSDYISNDKNVLSGIWVDDTDSITSLPKTSSSNPAGPTNTYWNLAQEALRAAAHFGLTGAALHDANFVILQPPAYSDPNALNAGYCAFHDFTDPNAPGNSYYDGLTSPDGGAAPYLSYSNIPYQIAPALASGCGENIEGGKLDGFSIVLGHEIEETITDPGAGYIDPKTGVHYGGWFDPFDADENGDKCAWVGASLAGNPLDGSVSPIPGALGKITGNAGGTFTVQSLWSNADDQGTGYCAGAGTDSPVPAAAYGDGTAPDTPASSAAPTVSGSPYVGQSLTARPGTWTKSPSAYVYQWESCGSEGTGCTDIDGATSATYKLTSSDLGHRLAVQVYAANANGSSLPADSAPTSTVTAPPPPSHGSGGSKGGPACPSQNTLKFTLRPRAHTRVVQVRVYINGRLLHAYRGRNLRTVKFARPAAKAFTLRLVVALSNHRSGFTTWHYSGCSRKLVTRS